MFFNRILRHFIIAACVYCSFNPPASAQNHTQCIQTTTQDRYIHIAKIDLRCPQLELIGSQSVDKGTTVSAFAAKYQTNIAINANFYWKDFTPIGLVITDYKKISKYGDVRARVVFACDDQNHCMIEPKNQVAKINPKWRIAISGWHYYNTKTGKFECAASDKIGCSQSIFFDKHPRTMLGLDEKRQLLYLVVVEGRQLAFRGMTLDELAQLAERLTLTAAINLDGGGSSTMVLDRKRLSDLPFLQTQERAVSNHFGVKLKRDQ
ncbi:phosphodiester glycosidase family protein [Muribacter muris]|uniref:Phosphodiester glycosidase family protein n=1 Tax=Muribacter muris TaxID=67855 RepID=A0A4Y9JX45_9PAST|nr:phosphodiester glycosidase family protein [Muribacter muris]MBF0785251.1 phosphodiester glycosidase family protein [Muribacter muris]MBF0828387.1 phosphodiester glycosidase family protein [Muribacter muris]TFV10078.1 phosphodiester glycosidase family protein [Muribacter muris]